MFFVRSTFLRREDLGPFTRRYKLEKLNTAVEKDGEEVGPAYLVGIGGLEFHHLCIIAFKVSSVDNGLFDSPFGTELDDHPIDMISSSAPTSFPSVSHVHASSGEKEVTSVPKMLVTERHGESSVRNMRKIHRFGFIGEDRHDNPKQSKTGNAAVRVHGQLDVSVRFLGWF